MTSQKELEWQQKIGMSPVRNLKELYKKTILKGQSTVIAGTIDMKVRHWYVLAGLGYTNWIGNFEDYVALSNKGEELARELLGIE